MTNSSNHNQPIGPDRIESPDAATAGGRLIYLADGFWREVGDQATNSSYPLVAGGPLPVILVVAAYLCFVRRLGPRLMQSRRPLDLRWITRPYNLAMSLFNLYAFSRAAVLTNFAADYFGCKQVTEIKSPVERELIHLGYLYFLSKLVELLDTVFFILRKKQSQASNLHVFHHAFIVICAWFFLKFAPGGSTLMFPFLNSGVHAVMYGYYFLATFKGLQRHLWWKRYLTLAQMIQFVISMIHFSFKFLSDCEYSTTLTVVGFVFNFVFLVLFCNFYYHSYMKNAKLADKTHQEEEKKLA